MQNLFHIRTHEEIERHRRIMVSIWAYAYEFDHTSLVTDHHFDAECRKVNPLISTGRPDLDIFFATVFFPDSGIWIHHHPELEKVKQTYRRWYK